MWLCMMPDVSRHSRQVESEVSDASGSQERSAAGEKLRQRYGGCGSRLPRLVPCGLLLCDARAFRLGHLLLLRGDRAGQLGQPRFGLHGVREVPGRHLDAAPRASEFEQFAAFHALRRLRQRFGLCDESGDARVDGFRLRGDGFIVSLPQCCVPSSVVGKPPAPNRPCDAGSITIPRRMVRQCLVRNRLTEPPLAPPHRLHYRTFWEAKWSRDVFDLRATCGIQTITIHIPRLSRTHCSTASGVRGM